MDSAPTTTAPSAGGRCRAEDRWALIRLHVENQISLAAIARDSGTGLRTLERWQAAYRARGFDGLKPAPPRSKRRHRLQPELGQLIEGPALMRPRNCVATIHRKVVELCGKRNWPIPSYSLVWTIVQEIDPGMRVLALEGPVAYRDKYELALRRHADLPNAMWQADHITQCSTFSSSPRTESRPGPGCPSSSTTSPVLRAVTWSSLAHRRR